MDSVILTGASGFVGSHCIDQLLEAGYFVHAFYNKQRSESELKQHEKLNWHRVDILDPAQVTTKVKSLAATHLLHLAWYAEPDKFWDSRQNLEWLRSSIHLVKVFAEAGGKRFVGAGSCAEYDLSQAGKMNEVDTPLAPATLFGSCKSTFFQTAQQTCKSAGLEFAWGRIFWLYGPGENKSRLVPYVINSLLLEDEANCGEGTQERDYLYVGDVARAFACLLNSTVQGAVNIASGEAVSIKSLVETIARLIDKQDLLQFSATEANKNESASIVADTTRLSKELNFKPERSLEQGLLESLEWWRKQHQRPSTKMAL